MLIFIRLRSFDWPFHFCWPPWMPCWVTWEAAETLVLITSFSNAQSPWVPWWFSTDKQWQDLCQAGPAVYKLFLATLVEGGCCCSVNALQVFVCCVGEVWVSVFDHCILTFSLWISFLIWEILIFMASISSSWTRGMGVDSQSSIVWNVRSASGMYHLQSYCCPFLLEEEMFV